MITIKTLSNTSFEEVHRAFIAAFADYTEPKQYSLAELQHTTERRGYNPSISFGAFNNDELVAFTLNGVGNWEGQPTAYDTGTGTVKEYRQQGLASRIFTESVPLLKAHGIKQYLLEVIRVNTKAFDLYKKQGFEVSREYDYYLSPKENISIDPIKLNGEFNCKQIQNPDWELLQSFWDFDPSWQNSIDSINRKKEHFIISGWYDGDTLAGYGIAEPATGDITQLAVAPEYRRKGLGTTILNELIKQTQPPEIKIINANAFYAPFKQFTESVGLTPGYGQYEMLLTL